MMISGGKKLIRSNLLNIKSEIWQRFVNFLSEISLNVRWSHIYKIGFVSEKFVIEYELNIFL